MNFVLSKNNKATIKEIIERFENTYSENEIRACMTPLLIAGKLDEHIVYSVVNDKTICEVNE